MGYSRRKEAREIAESIRESRASIAGLTLGQACAAGLVFLDVSCYHCQRRGRYRLTRLIDHYGAGKGLPELLGLLSADCLKRRYGSLDSCGAHFPGAKGNRPD